MSCYKRLFAGVVSACAISTIALADYYEPPEQTYLQPSKFSDAVLPERGTTQCRRYSAAYTGEIKGRIPVKQCRSGDDVYTASDAGDLYYEDQMIPIKFNDPAFTGEYNCNTREVSFSGAPEGIGIDAAIVGGKKRQGEGGGEVDLASFDYDEDEWDDDEGKPVPVVTRFIYGSKRLTDEMVTRQNPRNGRVLHTRTVSLCFGAPSTTVVAPLPKCDEDSEFAAVNCEAVANGTVFTFWQPFLEEGEADDDRIAQCICSTSDTATSGCSLDQGGAQKPCYVKEIGQTRATTAVEFDADPITCTTRGGTRTCKCVDNPFLPGDDCANFEP